MGKLTCDCLNIKVHTKTSDLIPVELTAIGISHDTAEEFFEMQISEVQLNIEGVRFEHQSLVREDKSSDWMVYKCMNCEVLTHAKHAVQGSGKVLVNCSLRHEPSSIEQLYKSPNFSPLYKIVLESKNDNHPIRTLGVQSGKYESLQKTLTDIQQQLNSFVLEEEMAMEERIRKYEKTQKSAYEELQSRARRDKNAMISLILSSEEHDVTQVLSDAMSDSPPSPLSPTTDDDIEPRLVQASRQSSKMKRFEPQGGPKKKFQSLSERMEATKGYGAQRVLRQEKRINEADGDLDFDSAFNEDSNRPFYHSDDELDDTDDSEPDTRSHKVPSLYSASVPISMPMWGQGTPSRKSFLEYYEDDEAPPPDPETMAASIKALAQSVHEDGTEIFGELPRRRRLTSDLGKI